MINSCFPGSASLRHLNETGSSLIIQPFSSAQYTLWNSSSEEKSICLLWELHVERLNGHLLKPHSTRESTKINLQWSELRETVFPFHPRFYAVFRPMKTEFLFVPRLWWWGMFSMEVCPTFPLDSGQLGPDQEDSRDKRQSFGTELWWSRTRISSIFIGFTLKCLKTETNIVQRENTRSLGLPSFSGLGLLKLVKIWTFACLLHQSFLLPGALGLIFHRRMLFHRICLLDGAWLWNLELWIYFPSSLPC